MNEDTGKAILGPRPSRFAAEITIQTPGPTLHLALLHRQVDFRCAGIPGDDVEFYACDFFDKPGKIVAQGSECRGATAWMLRHVANVIQCFIGRIGPAINDPNRPLGRSNPGKPRPIELDFFHICELIEIQTRDYEADRQPIRLGAAVYILRRRQRACGGHVLYNDVRLSRDVLAHPSRKCPPPEVADSSWRETEHQTNRLIFEERRLGSRVMTTRKHQEKKNRKLLQTAFLLSYGAACEIAFFLLPFEFSVHSLFWMHPWIPRAQHSQFLQRFFGVLEILIVAHRLLSQISLTRVDIDFPLIGLEVEHWAPLLMNLVVGECR